MMMMMMWMMMMWMMWMMMMLMNNVPFLFEGKGFDPSCRSLVGGG
jgi:hypothetical protein|eukprot:SAG25_NODE_113_length_14872_cov_23.149527_16_plen_45_part_00